MAFTVTFKSSDPPVPVGTLADWLTERGEPFVAEGEDTLALRAIPLTFVSSPLHTSLQAHLEVGPHVVLTRMVDTVFDVSNRVGADVHLAGRGATSRPALWMLLADEQDRVRIAAALRAAREHGDADEVHKRLWGLIASLRPGHDDRWDAAGERVIELQEVGLGITLEQAQWHRADAAVGDLVPVPVGGLVHSLVWRWLSDAYPRLTT
ncbi:MAG: hypothetical protein ABMA64_25835 [Myxococcota bacterium]